MLCRIHAEFLLDVRTDGCVSDVPHQIEVVGCRRPDLEREDHGVTPSNAPGWVPSTTAARMRASEYPTQIKT